jgi:hypothetical protein
VGVSFSPKLQREIVEAKRYLSNLYAPKSAVQTLFKLVGEGALTEFHVAEVARAENTDGFSAATEELVEISAMVARGEESSTCSAGEHGSVRLDGGLKDGHIGSAERLDTEVLDSGNDEDSMGAQTTPASAQNSPVYTALILASPVSPSTSSQTPGGALVMASAEAMHEMTMSFRVEKAAPVTPVIKGRSTTMLDSFSREEVVAFGEIQDPAVMAP